MTLVKIAAVCAVFLIASCSDRIVDVQVPTSHVANADAAAAPLPEPSVTLAVHQEPDADGVLLIPRLDAEPEHSEGDEHAHHHHHGDVPLGGSPEAHGAPAGIPVPSAAQPVSPPTSTAVPGASSSAATGVVPAAHAELFWCTHHHEVVQSGPGKCPTCGMTLVPKPADGDRK